MTKKVFKAKTKREFKFYLGYIEGTNTWESFLSSLPSEATPGASGYNKVKGPFNTRREAEEACRRDREV